MERFLGFQSAPIPLLRRRSGCRAISTCRRRVPQANLSSVEGLPLERIPDASLMPPSWGRPGVYGVYDKDGDLQYVSAVTNVQEALSKHQNFVNDADRVHSVRMITVDAVEDAPLDELAENWVVTHTQAVGAPPGNTDRAPEWRIEREVGFNIKFGEFATEEDARDEIEEIVSNFNIVLFMKGTFEEPMCGFSRAALDNIRAVAGNRVKCVNCLDEYSNPGLRAEIKKYSDWPTIPQLYIDGEFVGGADIIQSMVYSGELEALINKSLASEAL